MVEPVPACSPALAHSARPSARCGSGATSADAMPGCISASCATSTTERRPSAARYAAATARWHSMNLAKTPGWKTFGSTSAVAPPIDLASWQLAANVANRPKPPRRHQRRQHLAAARPRWSRSVSCVACKIRYGQTHSIVAIVSGRGMYRTAGRRGASDFMAKPALRHRFILELVTRTTTRKVLVC